MQEIFPVLFRILIDIGNRVSVLFGILALILNLFKFVIFFFILSNNDHELSLLEHSITKDREFGYVIVQFVPKCTQASL